MASSIQETEVAVGANPKSSLGGDALPLVNSFGHLWDHATSDPTFGSNNAISRKSSLNLGVADEWEYIQRDIDPENEKMEETRAEEKAAKPTAIDRPPQRLISIMSIPEAENNVPTPLKGSEPKPEEKQLKREVSLNCFDLPRTVIKIELGTERNSLFTTQAPEGSTE
jgi:hypothetical protein